MNRRSSAFVPRGDARGRVFHVDGAYAPKDVDGELHPQKWYAGIIFDGSGAQVWRGANRLDHDRALGDMAEKAAVMDPPVTDLQGSMGQPA